VSSPAIYADNAPETTGPCHEISRRTLFFGSVDVAIRFIRELLRGPYRAA
jgi:hypothetical protein